MARQVKKPGSPGDKHYCRRRAWTGLRARTILLSLLASLIRSRASPFPDTPFLQEHHEAFPVSTHGPANDVQAVAVDTEDRPWAATAAGIYCLDTGSRLWTSPTNTIGIDPALSVCADPAGGVYVGAWNGLHHGTPIALHPVPAVYGPITAIAGRLHPSTPGSTDPRFEEVCAVGPDGIWRGVDDQFRFAPLPCGGPVRAVAPGTEGSWWLATGLGLYHLTRGGGTNYQSVFTSISADVHGVVTDGKQGVWAGCLGGVFHYPQGTPGVPMQPISGLPSAVVQSLTLSPGGQLWVATDSGIARHLDPGWSWRQSRRWLADDNVRGVAFDRDQNAWVATAAGISEIRRSPLTLAVKATRYHQACEARHVRPPGIVEKCRLLRPGDLSSWAPQDDDNDGGYTALYLAMESFRFAGTRDEKARTNAARAFAALELLQTITETPGFLARTVIPADWKEMHDPNETVSDAEWAATRAREPRHKRVPERWRLSRDRRWLWKGDTSSDEITAHMFGYYWYHALAASEADRARVARQVDRVVGKIVEDGYLLLDLDGKPTRWGVWSPERLNHDPNWAVERGVNSVEILSYLKLAHDLTGSPRYLEHYRRLLYDHHYLQNVRHPKCLNPSARSHIDDELLAFCWPILIPSESTPEIAEAYREGLRQWHQAVREDHTPLFEFLYASLTGDSANTAQSVAFLRDQPLDLIRWTVDNSRREDLRLVRAPELEFWQTDRLLPPSERGTPRTDENPFMARQGDGGDTESDGVFWLLPYWMARYHGIISAPAESPATR